MHKIAGGVTAPKGFFAAGTAAGIKENKKDLALLKSREPAIMAAAFTTNVVKAASVLRNQTLLKAGTKIKGIVINSGNANACTGEAGEAANQEMAEAYAKLLCTDASMVLTASTGVIGAPFPIEKVKKGIADAFLQLGNEEKDGTLAAESIMTTDTRKKELALEVEIAGKCVTFGAMAKGSGMIHPNMATMLAFVTTDCAISKELLQKALYEDIKSTYNMVSVDGDTSTNDTIVVLANGLAENEPITEEGEEYKTFCDALHTVNEYLAKELVRDGEGATKFIEISVSGAKTEADAKTLAKSVVTSSLVKTAMYGEDANWGRVLCAMGYAGIAFDTQKVEIKYESKKGSILLMTEGTPTAFDETKASEILSEKEITVFIQMGEGSASAKAWGCDLSHEYVSINGDYRS